MNARLSDITLWGLVTAFAWTFGGVFCAIIFYENINQIPTTQPTPEHMQLLVRILLPWAVIGFIVGVFGLFKFLYLADVLGPVRVYPVHVVQMSVVSLIVASLLGLILYPIFVPPPGAVLRSFFWRIPLSAIAGLTATNMALKMIGTLGRIMP